MKKIFTIPIGIIALAVTTWSCTKKEVETEQPTVNSSASQIGVVIPNEFNYATTKVIDINITAKGVDQNPLGYTKVEVFEGNPYDNENCKALPIATMYTNSGGKVTGSYPIPTAAKKLYALIHTKGLQSVKEIDVNGSNANIDFEAAEFTPPIATSVGKQQQTKVANYVFLDNYDVDGVPLGVIHTNIPQSIMDIINVSLPESRSVPMYNPEYLSGGNMSNIHFIEKAIDVSITFIHEGAGNLNSFGFYFYDTSAPPATKNDIDNIYVVFPNASFGNGGGGNLTTGDKINITGNPLIAQYEGIIDTIQPGTGLGWVLFRSSWVNNQ
ncbi:MAG: hypothetical protein KAG96_03760, partial [Ichthyobacteriaceae bacterium]|nr:hypothetical protein [Ichthyobacteriaceae bacterium]